MVHFGSSWPEEVHFGPFRSANRTLAIPDKCPFARNVRSENEILDISLTELFTIASKFIRGAQFAAFSLRFGGQNWLAKFQRASEFAFAFAVVSLRPRFTQLPAACV